MERIFESPELLLPALAEYIVSTAKDAIAAHGRFSFVLSGGSSPKKLYELLASNTYKDKIDWANVFFFFGDERAVPHDHPDSNFLMANKSLFTPLAITAGHIFAVDTSLPAPDAARAYEATITSYFKGQPCRFDLILLGLGDNSHTASLFPHTPVLHETKALVSGLYIAEVSMDRITFTAPLINLGLHVAFLVYGAGKAEAVYNILKRSRDIELYPAQLIHPDHGDVIWFLDKGSAARITD